MTGNAFSLAMDVASQRIIFIPRGCQGGAPAAEKHRRFSGPGGFLGMLISHGKSRVNRHIGGLVRVSKIESDGKRA